MIPRHARCAARNSPRTASSVSRACCGWGSKRDVESDQSVSEQGPLTPDRPAQRFEHYEVLRNEDGTLLELGRGSMGVTYKAFDVDLRCPVTLKVISERYVGNESARLRFLREARATNCGAKRCRP